MTPEDFNNLRKQFSNKDIEELIKLREALQRYREQNYDPRPKEVGDRVQIWDYSLSSCLEGGGIKPGSEEACIVVSNKEREEADVMGHKVELNLLLWSSKLQKHIRTSSEFVKLL